MMCRWHLIAFLPIACACGPTATPVAQPTVSQQEGEQSPPPGHPCPSGGDGAPSRDCLAHCIEREFAKANISVTSPFEHQRLRNGVLAAEMDAVADGVEVRLATALAESNDVTSDMDRSFGTPPGAAFFFTCPNESGRFTDPLTHVEKLFVLALRSPEAEHRRDADKVCSVYKTIRLDHCEP
jgi:hypothetical protein